MPDIDPSAINRPDPIQTSLNPSNLSLSRSNGISAPPPASKAVKTINTGLQRFDLEPIYTSLKAAIGEHWGGYKEAIGRFVLGELNQSELSLRIDHFILSSPETEHLHNSLITGIYANSYREPPEPGLVAPWVSANDKPSSGVGGGGGGSKGGDKVEERSRREVMGLPARDRRRLKEVGERDAYDPLSYYPLSAMSEYRAARSIKLPDSVPASAGGLNKTTYRKYEELTQVADWDIEIRRRYANPLFHETGEFPDETAIANRMLPICYEEALPNGPADQCAEFMAIATEMFVKDVVGSVLGLVRSNITAGGAKGGGVFTRSFKRGNETKDSGLGPGTGQRPLGMGDLRVALGIADCSLGQMPDIVNDIMSGWPEGVLEGWDVHPDETDLDVPRSVEKVHKINSTLTNGLRANGVLHAPGTNSLRRHHEPGIDQWPGSGTDDRTQLFSLLDECLAVGQ
ncbi:MAG: hypothetical protein Q9217_005079 [Psora testacea]